MSNIAHQLKFALVAASIVLVAGCATTPIAYTKATYDRPHKLLINLPSDPRNWREEWRAAFNAQGYEVIFRDEIAAQPDSNNTTDMPLEFHLAYRGTWDLVWYVRTVDLSVTDLRTGQTVGNYSEENLFAHPGVRAVVDKIEHDFLATLWKPK